jgi:hypothetical protein
MTLLGDREPGIQLQAASVLQRIGTLALDPVLQALGAEQTSVQHHAISLLVALGTPAVMPLLQILDSDKEVVRKNALHALDRLRPPATDILVKFVQEEWLSLPYEALEVLVQSSESQFLQDTFLPLVQTTTPLAVRVKALEVLTAAEIPPNLGVFARLLHEGNPAIRQQIITLLGKIGASSLPIIRDTVWDGEAAVRETALDVLGQIGDSSTIDTILTLCDDWHVTIQQKATTTLARVCEAIEVVRFGVTEQPHVNLQTCWVNPDVSVLAVSLPSLKRVEIETDTYSFHAVERFLTYALEYLGQQYLKHQIDVHLYGNPEHLHVNLRNSFTHLCRHVITHSTRSIPP